IPEGQESHGGNIITKNSDPKIEKLIIESKDKQDGTISHGTITIREIKDSLTMATIPVANIKAYGTVGILIAPKKLKNEREECRTNLILISQLGATFFEKMEAELIISELAVADEQDRIADDIHDSVVQRLFASSLFGYDAIQKWDELSDKEKREQMTLITETIQSALKDLRSTIYNLSSKKKEMEVFGESLRGYLKDMERLSGIDISFHMTGDVTQLSLSARKAIYRIITEGTGNAVKHAGAKGIWVNIDIGKQVSTIAIEDDGQGLDLKMAREKKDGLGLYNIESLVRLFKGKLNIDSQKGRGTRFNIEFDTKNIIKA
ncbi:MAG: hypothetical protein GX974_09470, partial [Clostridiales bacterium]|nr:hypothetical protein [Clostridiales bacterium]